MKRISVDINEEEYERLKEIADEHNVKVSLILGYYVRDLVCSARSNGSDERQYAQDYFQRTNLSWMFKDEEVI
ncbi:hypothetical protein [Jeotgalibacillus malaysiensis]|uniref:hypothetical protein n=1 Tax=Jeotgalibacillus malaysiensis TaxID=1508404 RepID=UPI00384DDFD0